MTLPSSFQFYACPKARQGQEFTLYSARVDGASLIVSWPAGENTHGGSVSYSLSIAQDYFNRNEWSIFEVPQPATASAVHERLRSIAASMSYADDENIAAGKFRLYELAGDLERGKAHVRAAPVPTETEQLIAVANAGLYDLTFECDGKIRLHYMGQRNVRLNSVTLGLKWFDLKAQLDALEAAQ